MFTANDTAPVAKPFDFVLEIALRNAEGKTMKLLALVVFLFGTHLHAETLDVYCEVGELANDCAMMADEVVKKLGCSVGSKEERTETVCQYAMIDDPDHPGETKQSDHPVCVVTSSNCTKVQPGSDDCAQHQSKVYLPKKMHNGNWFGLLGIGSWSRVICKNKS